MEFYIDTSIFGGFFDKEFDKATRDLFDFIEANNIEIIGKVIILGK